MLRPFPATGLALPPALVWGGHGTPVLRKDAAAHATTLRPGPAPRPCTATQDPHRDHRKTRTGANRTVAHAAPGAILVTTIRPLTRDDHDAWRRMWTAYLSFYETTVSEEVYATYFERLLGDDPHDFSCLIAEIDGRPVGLTHYVFHRHGWRIENVCYLQDLYAEPEMRGRGVGRALIEAVYAAADARGCPSVYWMTQHFNHEARRLYDRIGVLTPFIKYQRP